LTKRTVVVLIQRNKNPANLELAGGGSSWFPNPEGSLVMGIGRHSDAGASTARRLSGSGFCAKSAWKNPRQPKLTGEGIETWNDR
jgi:hypothetical protein